MNLPFKTLPDLLNYFNHEDKCRDFLEKLRWPDGNIVALHVVVNTVTDTQIRDTINADIKNVKAGFLLLLVL